MFLRKFSKNQIGLSLIEIMVAFSILVVAFVGLAQAFPFGLSINKTAENSTIASYLTQDKIEELFSLGYDDVGLGIIETKQRLAIDPINYLYQYQRQTEIDYVDGNLATTVEDSGMKRISVTVYFNNAISNQEQSYNIATLISRK